MMSRVDDLHLYQGSNAARHLQSGDYHSRAMVEVTRSVAARGSLGIHNGRLCRRSQTLYLYSIHCQLGQAHLTTSQSRTLLHRTVLLVCDTSPFGLLPLASHQRRVGRSSTALHRIEDVSPMACRLPVRASPRLDPTAVQLVNLFERDPLGLRHKDKDIDEGEAEASEKDEQDAIVQSAKPPGPQRDSLTTSQCRLR